MDDASLRAIDLQGVEAGRDDGHGSAMAGPGVDLPPRDVDVILPAADYHPGRRRRRTSGPDEGNRTIRRSVGLTLALLPTVLLIAFWAAVGRGDRMSLLEDDAFYYLGVARSIAEGHGSTFAGSISTNGYHPLWLVILVPITALVQNPDRLVLALLLLQGVLWAASVREILRIGRSVGTWYSAVAGISVYAVLTVMTGHLAFNGMESALVLYLYLVLVRMGLTGRPGTRRDLELGVVLALICLARLDAVFAAVPVAFVLLIEDRPSPRRFVRRAVVVAAPAGVALAAYVALNIALFDTPTPVSGQMKAMGAPSDNMNQLWGFLKLGSFQGHRIWFGAVSLLLVGAAVLSGWWRASTPLRRLTSMMLALVVGEAVLVTYLVTSTSFTHSFAWYHYEPALFGLAAVMVLSAGAISRFGRPAQLVCLGLVGCMVVGSIAEIIVKAREPTPVAVLAAADFVDTELPDDALIAMGDRAGYFGYLADRSLLHLEGLVADAAYLRQVEDGEALDRMNDEGVDYYVSNARPGIEVTIDGRQCWRFVEPPYTFGPTFEVTVCDRDLRFLMADDTGRSLAVWRYRPELNRRA